MKLFNSGGQQVQCPLFCADGTVTTGGTAQLVLARSLSRSSLILENKSNANLLFEFGSARATATLTSGTISSFTITNAGFGYTYPPSVQLYGGGYGPGSNTRYLGLGQPGGEAPHGPLGRPAQAHAVLSGGAISSIVVDDPGLGYAIAPYVWLEGDPNDPNGCALPSATVGLVLLPGGSLTFDSTVCPTEPISVYGGTTGQAFACRWTD